MKWVWIIFSSLLVPTLQADVLTELARCDGIVEPAERLICFNDVAKRHKAPDTSGVTSIQAAPIKAKVIDKPFVEIAPVRKTSTQSVETASASARRQSSGMFNDSTITDAIETQSPQPAIDTATTTGTSLPATSPVQPAKRQSSVALVESQNNRPDWDKPKERSPQALRATIVDIKRLSRGQYVLTFDDGQVWREIEPRRQSRYSVGDEIVITRAFGGSFNLKSSATGYRNKVRRVE